MSQTLAEADRPPADEQHRPRPWRDRLAGLSASERFWSWAGPLAVTLIGGLVRFWHLDRPHKLIFDETYYVKEGVSYLKYGYEMALRPDVGPDPNKLNDAADKLFNAGNLNIYGTAPDRVVHPMVGKWMIAFGEWLFGPTNPIGWRFAVALCGTLSILMLGRIAYRLFGSALLATTAALLLAVDGEHFVQSRTGILDIFIMFWALAAFGCLLIDRDHTRARLARLTRLATATGTSGTSGTSGTTATTSPLGPWLGLRWWRIAAVVCLGLCTGVKWSGIYFAAAFLALSVLWDVTARRSAGVRHWFVGAALKDGVQAFATTVVLLPAVYLATWVTWFTSSNAWNRQWGAQHAADPGWGWVPNALRSLWHYHAETWAFHVSLTVEKSPHDWMANPWTWIIQGRPTLFFFDTHTDGHAGCHVDTCRQMITDLGNPMIWWGGTLAIAVVAFQWLLARDWRAGAIAIGVIGGYLPWFLYQQRTIFQFYAVAFVPWVVLAVTYCLGLIIGPRHASVERRRIGGAVAGSYVFLAVLMFWYFYPVLSAKVLPQAGVDLRDWLPSWY